MANLTPLPPLILWPNRQLDVWPARIPCYVQVSFILRQHIKIRETQFKLDLPVAVEWEVSAEMQKDGLEEIKRLREEAVNYIRCYDRCISIRETCVGMMCPVILAIFLLNIAADRVDVDSRA